MDVTRTASISDSRNHYKHLLEQVIELLAEAKRRSAEMDNDPTTVVTHAELKQKLAEKARALHVGTDV